MPSQIKTSKCTDHSYIDIHNDQALSKRETKSTSLRGKTERAISLKKAGKKNQISNSKTYRAGTHPHQKSSIHH